METELHEQSAMYYSIGKTVELHMGMRRSNVHLIEVCMSQIGDTT